MPDPNLTIPADATPNWLLRYAERRTRAYDRRIATSSKYFPRLRNQRSRRTFVVILVLCLDLAIVASIVAFWHMAIAAIPFTIGVFVSVVMVTLIRITTDAVADAPADALDEIQLAQRNAARSLAYSLLVPIILVIYFVAIAIAMRDEVAGQTVGALAWLLISTLLAVTCLPDILLTWWLPDEADNADDVVLTDQPASDPPAPGQPLHNRTEV